MAGRERKNLALALKDTRSVVGTLTYVSGAILQLCFFFLYLLVLRVRQGDRHHLAYAAIIRRQQAPKSCDHSRTSSVSGMRGLLATCHCVDLRFFLDPATLTSFAVCRVLAAPAYA